MAMFREHISVGAVAAVVCVTIAYYHSIVTEPRLLVSVFAGTAIASFLPDLDSDSGLPFYLVYGTLTLLGSGVALYITLLSEPSRWYMLIVVPLGVMIFLWFVVGYIIKRCTKHRGIFHSVPAALIAGCGAYLVAQSIGHETAECVVVGVSFFVGYMSHLVLDEIHSSVNLEGKSLGPKRSLGTALKLFSQSKRVTLAAYLALFGLLYTILEDGSVSAFMHTLPFTSIL